MLDNKADAHILSLGYLCVNLHLFNTWYTCMVETGVVKSKMAVTEGDTERYGCLHNIYLSNE